MNARRGVPCPHCDRTFAEDDHRDLHVGRDHTDAMTPDEWIAFEAAREHEDEWLDHYARHMRAGLVSLPVWLLYAFIVIALLGLGGNPAWIVMATPGTVFFGGIIYYMVYSSERRDRSSS